MKKLLTLLLILLLSACANTMSAKITMNWPDTPPDLKTACPDLGQVDTSTTKLSDALNTITSNYSQYYLCKDKVDNWLDWYNTQQKIFNSVK
jgi:hypothetical protein